MHFHSYVAFFGAIWSQNYHPWVGGNFQTSFSLLLGLGLWAAITPLAGSFAVLFNGAGIVKFQLIPERASMAVVNLGLSIALVHWIGIVRSDLWKLDFLFPLVLAPSIIYFQQFFSIRQSSQ